MKVRSEGLVYWSILWIEEYGEKCVIHSRHSFKTLTVSVVGEMRIIHEFQGQTPCSRSILVTNCGNYEMIIKGLLRGFFSLMYLKIKSTVFVCIETYINNIIIMIV